MSLYTQLKTARASGEKMFKPNFINVKVEVAKVVAC